MADTEARVLTEDVEQLGTVDAWLAERREQVAGIAAEYQPREITSRDEYRQCKRERAAARKAIKAVEDERRQKLGAIKDAVRGIEAEVRDLLEPLRGIDDGYREAIEAYERARHQAVLAEADAHYRELAPDLADMVPLSRLEEAYGLEGKWSSASMTGPRLCQLVDGYVDAIAADERTIEQLELPEEETRALKADFFSTLDLSAALRRANERKAKREEVERLEAERAERRRQREALEEAERRRQEAERAERERLEREEAERAAAEAERRAREETEHEARLREAEEARLRRAEAGMEPAAPGDAPMAPEAAPAPEFAPFAPMPEEVEAPPVPMPDTAPQAPAAPIFSEPGEEPVPWVVVVDAATRSQMEMVAKAIGSLGVRGRVLPGTLAQAFDRTRG